MPTKGDVEGLPGPEECCVNAVLKKCGNPIHANMDEVFRKGLGSERVNKRLEWEEEASGWQLEVEKWEVEDKAVMHLEKET